MKIFVLIMTFFGLNAMAETYHCVLNQSPDPWWDEAAVIDEWTIEVDLKAQTAALSSYNFIFGENPFAVLKLKKNRSQVYTFVGRNKYEPSHRYVFEFEPGCESFLSTKEGRGASQVTESVSCRKIAE